MLLLCSSIVPSLASAQSTGGFIFVPPEYNEPRPKVDDNAGPSARIGVVEGELKDILIEISFFRQLHAMLTSQSQADVDNAQLRYSLSDSEVKDVTAILGSWKQELTEMANERRSQACAVWNQSARLDSSAEEVLGLHMEMEGGLADEKASLFAMRDNLQQFVSMGAANTIEKAVDNRKASKPSLNASSWSDGVRTRGNAISELNSTCGGAR